MPDSCPIVDKQMKIWTRNIALGKKSLTNQLQKAMRPKKTYETKDEHENINHFTQHGNVFFKEQSYHERATSSGTPAETLLFSGARSRSALHSSKK